MSTYNIIERLSKLKKVRKYKDLSTFFDMVIEHIKNQNAIIYRQKDEIARLDHFRRYISSDWTKILISEIKAEAHKEFADKVENEIDCQPCSKGMQESAERYRIKRIINNVLKELVGD